MAVKDDPPMQGDVSKDQSALLHRGLGVLPIAFMVIAAMAPLGASAVVLPSVFALSGNGAAPVYFIAATLILALFAVGFTLMGRHVQNAGAFYTYVQAGMGRMAGAGTAALALVSYLAFLIALYAYLGFAASAVIDTYLDVAIDWQVLTAVSVLIVAYLGYRDVELSAKVLGVALVTEVLLIAIIDLAIIFQGGADGLSAAPLNPREALNGAPGLGLMFAFFAFVGFEATAVFRSEATSPDRTVPRATYGAVGFIGFLYAVTSWAQAVGVGADQVSNAAGVDPAALMVNLSTQYVGSTFTDLFQVLLVTSIFAAALCVHNVVTRYQFSMANGGLLPAGLGRVHPKNLAPSRSSFTVTAISTIALIAMMIGGLDPVTQIYTWFSGTATLGILVLMALTSLAVLIFHQRRRGDDPVWHTLIAPVLSLVGLGAVVWLVVENLPLLVGGKNAAVAVCVAMGACFVGGAIASAALRGRPVDSDCQLPA